MIDGYPGDYTKEWATVGGGAGSWLKLTWTSSQTIDDVVLYDRPNTNDQVTGGTLTFSDGSTVNVPTLNNNGAATTVTFPAKTTTSVLFTVSSVSSTTQNVGLSEIEVFPPQSGGGNNNAPPTADAGADQVVSTGATVQLDGSASYDPGGNPSYKWTQTSGPAVTLSDPTSVKPTFTAPSNATSLAFQLVVTDGSQTSDPSSVTITVKDQEANIAPQASATASSQNTSTGQTAAKAIDGVIDGYPGDYTKEWATVGGGAGSWLKLTWTSPQTISKVVLYDRPNANDQVTGGTLTFSDGTTVNVPSLNNDGSATTVTFPAVTTTSLLFTVTSVSSTTFNVGLAEIQVYPSGSGPGAPTANAGPDQAVTTGATVQLDGSGSSDPGGNPSYQWTQTAGPNVTLSSSTAVKPTFTAPSSATTLTFQLVVTDGSQSSQPDTVKITVSPPSPPTANAGPDQAVTTGATVQLDGSGSSDPGGNPSYQWTQTAGPNVTLSSSTAVKPTFTAPSSATTLTFQLVVTDGSQSSQPDTVKITVSPPSPPTANAGPDQAVTTGATVQLDGSGSSDPGGNPSYQWTQTAGPNVTLSSSTAVKPTFTAPSSATTLTFQLVVTDGSQSSQPDTVKITVSPPSPPTANAGPDQAVTTGATVQLDGSGSSDPGGNPSYQWTQTAGPNVTLSSSTAVKPTFTAPSSATTLTFQLVVTDGSQSSQPDTVKITVSPPSPPTANAGPDQAVTTGATVQLDGSGSSDPGGNPSYQWTQTAGPNVTLSSSTAVKPTFTAPSSATTLTFQLVVTDGSQSSQPDTVNMTVSPPNIALQASATASSQNTSTGQTAAKAIDGVIDGYPGDYTKEWATVGGGAGSWLKLTWTSPQTISKVVLYDRPNANDQVTGGKLTFSDGTTVNVPSLNNDGSATTVTFPAVTTTSLLFTVTSVSSSTQNVGLSEIQAYPSS